MYTNSIFDEVFNLRDIVENFFNDPMVLTRNRAFPYVELSEKDEVLTLKALLPGVKSEDLNIQLMDTSLVIEGEKRSDYSESPYRRKERMFGKFKKSIKLPYRVEADKIEADLKNGILTIRLTKSEDAKPKQIAIH